MPPITLTIIEPYTPGQTIPSGSAALDTGPTPPEIVLSQTDVDALTNNGVADLVLVKDYVREALSDPATVSDLNAGALNSISGLRQKVVRNETIIEQAEGYAAALAELQRLTQGTFQLNFKVRTTTEDWRDGQQFKLRIPAKNITFMVTVSTANSEYVGTLSDGRDEILHNCTAVLSTRDPLFALVAAIRAQTTPPAPRKLRYEPE